LLKQPDQAAEELALARFCFLQNPQLVRGQVSLDCVLYKLTKLAGLDGIQLVDP
jgi:hypothetical protein